MKPTDVAKVLAFAGEALEGHCAEMWWDGGDVQKALLRHGLLEPVTMAGPCDPDHCACADVGEFPLECYRVTELGRQARLAYQEMGR